MNGGCLANTPISGSLRVLSSCAIDELGRLLLARCLVDERTAAASSRRAVFSCVPTTDALGDSLPAAGQARLRPIDRADILSPPTPTRTERHISEVWVPACMATHWDCAEHGVVFGTTNRVVKCHDDSD